MAMFRLMTTRIPIAFARKHFASVLRKTKDGERVKLTRYDKTIGAIIPKHDLDKLRECEGDDENGAGVGAKPKPKSK
jgi:antitoxin (DNA-binding transcriptional repressor) of toxin-antitoxin stability system